MRLSLDLVKLKRITRSKRKSIGKYTIAAQPFAEEFGQLCADLLRTEKEGLFKAATSNVKHRTEYNRYQIDEHN